MNKEILAVFGLCLPLLSIFRESGLHSTSTRLDTCFLHVYVFKMASLCKFHLVLALRGVLPLLVKAKCINTSL
jgi:hypothetical protein